LFCSKYLKSLEGTTNFFANGSVGFDGHNNPVWDGAATVARAGYRAQCSLTGSCDPADAPNIVSFKGLHYGGYSEPEAITAVQNEICSGNPVIMKFAKSGGGQHFMRALVKISGMIAPITKFPISVESSIQISIGGITGYQLYVPASDFKNFTSHEKTSYISNHPNANIHLDSTGAFEIDMRSIDLSNVDQNLLGAIGIRVDSTSGSRMVDLSCHRGRCLKSTERHGEKIETPHSHRDRDARKHSCNKRAKHSN
jgi:hypothetical protein